MEPFKPYGSDHAFGPSSSSHGFFLNAITKSLVVYFIGIFTVLILQSHLCNLTNELYCLLFLFL